MGPGNGTVDASEGLTVPADSPQTLDCRGDQMRCTGNCSHSGGHSQGPGRPSVTQHPPRRPSQPPAGGLRAPRAQMIPQAHPPASKGPLLTGSHLLEGPGGNQLTALPLTGGPLGTSSTRHLLPSAQPHGDTGFILFAPQTTEAKVKP